jgi:hypothetical protein
VQSVGMVQWRRFAPASLKNALVGPITAVLSWALHRERIARRCHPRRSARQTEQTHRRPEFPTFCAGLSKRLTDAEAYPRGIEVRQ